MKCEDMLELLGDYVDGQIDPALCKEFERHLEGCNPCKIVIDTVKETVTLYKGTDVYELPAPFRERLHQTLRERWQEKRSPPAGSGAEPLPPAGSA